MNSSDRFIDETLHNLAGCGIPDGISPEARARCMAALSRPPAGRSVLRRPAVLSTMGAALVVAVAGLLFPTNGGPSVRAATVLEKLSKQVTGADLIQVDVDHVAVDEVSANGQVYLGDKALAGDIELTVDEDEGRIEIDASFALSEKGGWVLVRQLKIPEPQAQIFIDMFLPAGAETLIKLPADLAADKLEDMAGVHGGVHHIREFASGHVAVFVKTLLESKSTAGAKTQKLADGTVLVSVEVKDAQTVRSLMEILAKATGQQVDGEIEVDDDDVEELIGAQFGVIYDPATESVRSFSVSGVHGIKGVVTVSLLSGEIAPNLLDSSRVTTAATRILDLSALLQAVDGLQGALHHGGHDRE